MSALRRQAIIDIGSNSIRLVVFGGAPRAPVVLYNEKIMAGLGRGVVATGRLDPAAAAVALAGLARFARLTAAMKLDSLDVVATAAVREAADGAAFLDKVAALGIAPRLLAGEEEAQAAGYGVVSGWPQADGTVADLGGGSLELVRVAGGEVDQRASFPLGAMRVAALRAKGRGKLERQVARAAQSLAWRGAISGKPIYLVGGSWRALARVHMHQFDFPLPVLANYRIPVADVRRVRRSLAATDLTTLASLPGIKGSRLPQLGDAAALLAAIVDEFEPSECVVSAFGLREGLLHARLSAGERAKDPLIEGVRFLAEGQQLVPGYPEALFAWLDQLFGHEPRELARLRHAVCQLRGMGWASNPDFRAENGAELALHGNWSGVDASDRAALALALFVGLGGAAEGAPAILGRLAPPALLERALAWGLAIRLAQRIGGGAVPLLAQTALRIEERSLILVLPAGQAALADTTLERRAGRLALALGLDGATVLA